MPYIPVLKEYTYFYEGACNEIMGLYLDLPNATTECI